MAARSRNRQKKRARKKTPLRDRIAAGIAAIRWPDARTSINAAAWIIGLGGLAAAGIFGVPKLQAYVAQHRPVTRLEVRFVDPPAWVSGDLEAWLALTVQQHLTADPLDQAALAGARTALIDTGCFEEVRQVRRASANRIEIDADFMQPFAVVVDRDGEHLVDPRGRLLPATYRVGPDSHFIRIHGAAFDRPSTAGSKWPGADLTAALHIIRMIDEHPWWRQINRVDVADGQRISLITHRGCRVIWGAAPGEEAIGEVTAEQKIVRLTALDRDFGRIDADCPNELDITDPEVVTAR